MKPAVLFLVGPTAAGKSEIALVLARRLGGEIISADSMQVYKGMDIGTAKPSARERAKVPHHLLDIVPPTRSFSVYEFRRRALAKIREVVRRKKLPIVTGGSGLYVRALLQGLSGQPGADVGLRNRLEREAAQGGLGPLYERLERFDPKRASQIRPQDKRRIIRALEIAENSGKKPSEWHASAPSLESLGFKPVVVGVTKPREQLYADIEKRVDRMFRKGLLREVQKLARSKLSKTAVQAVGYKELFPVLDGQSTIENAKNHVKINTRHLAKRQMTWFRREKGLEWVLWEKGDTASTLAVKISSLLL